MRLKAFRHRSAPCGWRAPTCATRVSPALLAARLATGLTLAALFVVGGPAAAADNSWNPFLEKDERAAQRRTTPPRAEPPPLAPVDRSVLDPRAPADGAPPTFVPPPGATTSEPMAPPRFGGPSDANTVERVELAPLPGTPAAEPSRLPSPGLTPLAPPPGAPEAPGAERPATAARASMTAPSAKAGPVGADLWRGVDMKALETMVSALDVPPRSPALHRLWLSLLTAEATPPAGGRGPSHYEAFRLEALYRSGRIGEMGDRLARAPDDGNDPLTTTFVIRRALADADWEGACAAARRLTARRVDLPKLLRGESAILSGYCGAIAGNPSAAGLAATLAREEEVEAPLAIEVLDYIGARGQAGRPKLNYPARLHVLDYRLLEAARLVEPQPVLQAAEPALLAALARVTGGDPRLTAAAIDAAAARNVLAPADLAAAYGRVEVPPAQANEPLFRRVQLFRAATGVASPQAPLPNRLTAARTLLDDARRAGIAQPIAAALAPQVLDAVTPREGAATTHTLVEIALAAGQFDRARQLAGSLPESQHWLALIDIADPRATSVSDGALSALDALARRNRMAPAQLHRLATILDALDVNVPIPLWEAASRTPQPTTGHLPETGLLPRLQEAAKKGETGRTALLAMATIGPAGAEATHLIGLGDAMRALRRVGFEAAARGLAVEALLAGWPRD